MLHAPQIPIVRQERPIPASSSSKDGREASRRLRPGYVHHAPQETVCACARVCVSTRSIDPSIDRLITVRTHTRAPHCHQCHAQAAPSPSSHRHLPLARLPLLRRRPQSSPRRRPRRPPRRPSTTSRSSSQASSRRWCVCIYLCMYVRLLESKVGSMPIDGLVSRLGARSPHFMPRY